MNIDPSDPRNIVGYGDPAAKHANLDSQFEELLEADNGLAIVKDILRADRMSRNTITINEFYKYAPLFRYKGVEELGEDDFVSLAEEYFRVICPFDPVSVVDANGKVAYLLPPIFNRTDIINMAGPTATNVAQAFVNACQLPDEVSGVKRSKYLNFYQQLFDVAQDKQRLDHVKRVSDEMASTLLHQVNREVEEAKEQNAEVQSLEQSNLNQKEQSTSSVKQVEILPYVDDDDVQPL